MAEVLHGGAGANQISVAANRTQAYGLAGNDTLTSNGKSNVLLIGGSGDDVLNMTGGNGTLSGGKGKDTFNLSYSAEQKISAVIEDIDPTNDKIVIAYTGDAPQLNSVISGDDVIWTDNDGYFNLTLKGTNDAGDYYDDEGNDYLWEVFKLTNQEREKENLSPLTMSQALSDGAAIRSEEIVNTLIIMFPFSAPFPLHPPKSVATDACRRETANQLRGKRARTKPVPLPEEPYRR